jgi:hypothetical protein
MSAWPDGSTKNGDLCKYWTFGNCAKGTACQFSHDPAAFGSNRDPKLPAVDMPMDGRPLGPSIEERQAINRWKTGGKDEDKGKDKGKGKGKDKGKTGKSSTSYDAYVPYREEPAAARKGAWDDWGPPPKGDSFGKGAKGGKGLPPPPPSKGSSFKGAPKGSEPGKGKPGGAGPGPDQWGMPPRKTQRAPILKEPIDEELGPGEWACYSCGRPNYATRLECRVCEVPHPLLVEVLQMALARNVSLRRDWLSTARLGDGTTDPLALPATTLAEFLKPWLDILNSEEWFVPFSAALLDLKCFQVDFSADKSIPKDQIVCKYWQYGSCKRGETCQWRHDEAEFGALRDVNLPPPEMPPHGVKRSRLE